jgi:hypothetical protein
MTIEYTTAHEADQLIQMRKPLSWPIHNSCTGSCNQGRACDCTADVADADEWVAGTWRDDLAFWGTVALGTFSFCTLLALALGWRL